VSRRLKLLVLTLLIEGMVFIVALLLARLGGIALFPLSDNVLRDILLGTCAASFPLALLIFSLSKKAEAIPLLRSVRKTVRTEVKAVFSMARLIDICFICICAGFAEELLFRGVIQVKGGIIVASVIFGLLHCITPAYIVMATIIGFYIGIIYYLYHSLLLAIQLHFVYDFGALIYLKYFVNEFYGTNVLKGLSN
jgi:membrane protease YdiL (CAAX protease family)